MEKIDKLDRKIIITNEKGKKEEGKVLFTFSENGDDFIIYELKDRTYAAKFKDEGHLVAVEDDEWKIVNKVFKDYQDSLEEENE